MLKPTVLIVGTCDTKLDEILYLRQEIIDQEVCRTKILDTSNSSNDSPELAAIADEVISPLKNKADELKGLTRGEYTEKAIEVCLPIVKDLVSQAKVQAIVSAGGSTNSSLATALMRQACPVGFPKLMVSTMASGDIKPYIEESDISMMYSVVDVAGLNSILKRILSNAASAISAMALSYGKSLVDTTPKPDKVGKRIAITMFGNTTPCVDHVRKILTTSPHDVSEYEIYVFHATGSGGRAMERLIAEGQIDAVIDVTTTEIADELFGGVLTAGPDRLEIAAKKGIPMVVSVGACDMVNFGARDTVPERYQSRKLLQHNPAVTLMRTTKENCHQIGRFIAQKLQKNAKDPEKIRVLIPEGGISMLDAPDKPFWDPEADAELFKLLEDGLEGSGIEVERIQRHINDELFAFQLSRAILEVMGVNERDYRLANARRRRWSFDHGASVMGARKSTEIGGPQAISSGA